MIQFVKHVQEMAYIPCDAVKRYNEHNIKTVPSSVRYQLVEARPLRFAPRNYVCVFVHNFAPA